MEAASLGLIKDHGAEDVSRSAWQRPRRTRCRRATRSPSQSALRLFVVRSRRSQIPDHQARYVVHKLSCFPVSEDVWAMQDCRMCQRFYYCHDDEGREIGIGDVDLISMCLEIAPDQCITLSDIGLDIFEPPNTWDLFRKYAMKLGIDAVSVDCNRNKFARRDLDWPRCHLDQGVARHLRNFLRMAVNDRRYQRLLAREVLVQRTDTDAGHLGNPVGARPVIAFLHQNASSRFQKCIDG
jgi:hypothetical protein